MRIVGRAGWLLVACLLAFGRAHAAEPPRIVQMIADPYFPPNQDATEVFVIGDAAFDGEDPVTVGTDPQNDGERRELSLFGMDARNLAIYQQNIDAGIITFALSVWDLQAVAPELTSWRWTFDLDGQAFQLEATRGGYTQSSTINGGPTVIAGMDGGDVFRLLGPCTDTACPYFGRVEGEIDPNSDRILWHVPIEAPFLPGSVVAPHPDGARTSFGTAVAHLDDAVTQTGSYTVLDRRVSIGVRTCTVQGSSCAPGGTVVIEPVDAQLPPPEQADLQPFWANIPVAGLARGAIGPNVAYEVVAEVCAGSNCGQPVTAIVWL